MKHLEPLCTSVRLGLRKRTSAAGGNGKSLEEKDYDSIRDFQESLRPMKKDFSSFFENPYGLQKRTSAAGENEENLEETTKKDFSTFFIQNSYGLRKMTSAAGENGESLEEKDYDSLEIFSILSTGAANSPGCRLAAEEGPLQGG